MTIYNLRSLRTSLIKLFALGSFSDDYFLKRYIGEARVFQCVIDDKIIESQIKLMGQAPFHRGFMSILSI